MIEIQDGFTSIGAGHDAIDTASRAATGARVTIEFCREAPLVPAEAVRVRYEFAGGDWREHTGIPQPIRTVVRWGRAVVHHYRLSYWIVPSALMQFAHSDGPAVHPAPAALASAPRLRAADEASAADRFRV